MKILYFILGSFEAKLGHWGYNSFHDFLQEDIIFFGPINEESFDHQGKRYPLIRFFKETSIDEIFAQLPENWIPDIVHCETTVMIFVPDIHKCPVKTCLNTADSWSSIVYNKKIACFFDTVRYGVIDKDEYVACKSTLLSTVNCAVSIPESDILPEDFSKRKIDILAIAKYDSGFYHDRYNAFFQASSSLNTKYRIRFINSVKRHQIHQYYQRSKIILDWAHTPSNRSYEAALNGCLLFCNEENTRIPEIWTPWEEYIPYNSSNLIELLDEYLSNPEKSRIIINNARKKLNLIPYTWGNTLLSQLKEALAVSTSLSDRIERIENMPAETFYSCLATPLYYNYFYNVAFPEEWKKEYFHRIGQALADSRDDKLLFPVLLEASRMAFLLNEHKTCFEYLTRLEEIRPTYAWIYYLKGCIQKKNNALPEAIESFNKAIVHAQKNPEEIKQYVLPFVEKKNLCDERRLTDYMWQSALKHDNEYQVKALLHMTYEKIGEVFVQEKNITEAIGSYTKAIQIIPIPTSIYALIHILSGIKDYIKIAEVTDRGLEDSPYDTKLILLKAHAILMSDDLSGYRFMLRSHFSSLTCFTGKRSKVLRVILAVLLFVSHLGSFLRKGFSGYITRKIVYRKRIQT